MSKLRFILCIGAALFLQHAVYCQTGKDGNKVVTALNTIVNEFTDLTANANAGSFSVSVSNSSLNTNGYFTANLSTGDLVMIIQVQGVTIETNVLVSNWGDILAYNNCGNYQILEVLSVPNATTINFGCPLQYDFSSVGHTQVIRIPRYTTLTVNAGASIITQAWNGSTGGVCIAEVVGATIINGDINVSGMGFRGGVADNDSQIGNRTTNFASANSIHGGAKGESIAGYTTEYNLVGGAYTKGAPANGGGGGANHNCGGGGGANGGNIATYNGLGVPDNSNPTWFNAWDLEYVGFSTNNSSGGGRGGYGFAYSDQNALVIGPGNPAWGGDNRSNQGGQGGRPLDYSTGRLFLGGGGGAGDGNDNCSSNGGNGGGMVYLLTYGVVSGTGNIIANGDDAPPTNFDGGITYYGIDSPGGAGGGGTIIINSVGATSGISLAANGGKGGDQVMVGFDNDNDGFPNEEAEGPGGGGGGGYIAVANGSPASTVNGGANGVTNAILVAEFPPNGATAGAIGTISIIVPYSYTLDVEDTIVCYNQPAVVTGLVNTADPIKPTIIWYDAISGNIIGSGNTLTTTPLTKDTVFYAKICYGTTITTGSITQAVNVTITLPPTTVATPTNIICYNGSNGQINTTVTGGNPTYTYSWSNGSSAPSLNGLAPGTYSVVITDSKGCRDTVTNLVITEPTELITSYTLNTPGPCSQVQASEATITANGGTPNYTYSWSGIASGETTQTASGLTAGNYSVIITDNVGCSKTETFSIVQPPPPLQLSESHVDILCFGNVTGSAIANPSDGTSPYTYSWDNNSTDQQLTNIAAGTYSVTVSDANNCTAVSTIIITEPVALTQIGSSTDINCFGNNNGSITITASGGVSTYSYSWDNNSTDNVLTGLAPATYSLVITDANGCTIDTSITITEPPQLISQPNSTNATCGNADATANITVSGGTAPYTYSWSNSNTTSSISNIGGGLYSVTVSDQNGCTLTENFTITDNGNVTASITSYTPVSCYNGSDGTATALGSGGLGTYSYSWLVLNGNTQTATGLSNGTYSVMVSDANNCSSMQTVLITQPAPLDPLGTFTQATCNLSNGSASVSVLGGTGSYTYSWSNAAETTTSISTISAGTYSVTITDNNGCDTLITINVTQPPLVSNQISSFINTTCAQNNGSAMAEAFSGTSPYSYSWLNIGINQPVASGLAPGTYSVLTLDANNCSDTATVTIAPSFLPDPSFTSVVNDTCGNSCFNVAANAANVSYNWSLLASNSNSLTAIFCVDASGNYPVTLSVTDSDGCVSTQTDTLTASVFVKPEAMIVANPLVVSILSPTVHFFNTSINASTWQWSFDPTDDTSTTLNPTYTYDAPGTYCTKLYAANNVCLDTAEVCVEVKPEFSFYVPNTFTPNGDGLNDTWIPKGINIDEDTYEMLVFDRWGAQIWKTNIWGEGWNGKANGGIDIAQIDTYVWMVRFRDKVELAEHYYVGHVNLIK